MTTKPNFKSEAFEAVHSAASALHKVGAIDKTTMREFDDASLVKPRSLADLREEMQAVARGERQPSPRPRAKPKTGKDDAANS